MYYANRGVTGCQPHDGIGYRTGRGLLAATMRFAQLPVLTAGRNRGHKTPGDSLGFPRYVITAMVEIFHNGTEVA